MTMTITEVIETLERVGGSREIDNAIHFDILGHERSVPFCEHCGQSRTSWSLAYTTNLEYAALLVPIPAGSIGRTLEMTQRPANDDLCFARAEGIHIGRARTLPVAVCIAGLKARAAKRRE